MLRLILVPLLLISVFAMGKCSAPEPRDPGYKVITRTDTKTVTKHVPSDMPASCRDAATSLAGLQEATEQLDVYTGRLGDLAQALGTFVEQPNAQANVNDRLQEVRDLQSKTARVGMTVLAAHERMTDATAQCDADLEVK